MSKTFPMTPHGYNQLRKKLDLLKTQDRPAVIEDIARAREYGDLSENAEYHAAREKQTQLERQIYELDVQLSNAQILDTSMHEGADIVFGAIVTLFDEDRNERITYQIVGETEADLKEKKIAITSALARALIGKEAGSSFELRTPGGERHYVIEKVSYAAQIPLGQ
jgi:transcription elongation factor GreA